MQRQRIGYVVHKTVGFFSFSVDSEVCTRSVVLRVLN